jgi:hypothetical protein
MNQRIPLLRILLSAAAAALSAVCAYALLMRYQDVFSQLPLYVLLVPVVWLLLFTAASFKPRLWILLTIPYFSVAVTIAVYSIVKHRFDSGEWTEEGVLCVFFLIGMGFASILFAGIRQMRARKRLTGFLGVLLSAALLLAPIFVFRGNPVTTIRARRTLCAWMEENLDRERYEVGDFRFEWLERSGYTYALLDRETGRRAWLEYSLGKNGDAPSVHASWDANR